MAWMGLSIFLVHRSGVAEPQGQQFRRRLKPVPQRLCRYSLGNRKHRADRNRYFSYRSMPCHRSVMERAGGHLRPFAVFDTILRGSQFAGKQPHARLRGTVGHALGCRGNSQCDTDSSIAYSLLLRSLCHSAAVEPVSFFQESQSLSHVRLGSLNALDARDVYVGPAL